MKKNQKYLPKYWVVHDKNTDDVFVQTMSKSLNDAENKFVKYCAESRYGDLCYDDLFESFYEDENLETILIEIMEVIR